MLYDLAALKKQMAEVLDIVDHKHLDKDVEYFQTVGSFKTFSYLVFNLCLTKI